MKTALVTGGSGFFGGILKRKLLDSGVRVVNIDLQKDDLEHPALMSVQGDIRNGALMERLYAENRFDAVFHCAAILAHVKGQELPLDLERGWYPGSLREGARKHGVSNLVFCTVIETAFGARDIRGRLPRTSHQHADRDLR